MVANEAVFEHIIKAEKDSLTSDLQFEQSQEHQSFSDSSIQSSAKSFNVIHIPAITPTKRKEQLSSVSSSSEDDEESQTEKSEAHSHVLSQFARGRLA